MNYQQKISDFIKSPDNEKWKIIVIYGPTACGKTWMGIKIAKLIDSEIISTDSRQIYSFMNIGTGKVTLEEMQWIPHHMIDIITPDMSYSVGEFKVQAQKIIQELHNKWKIPILVWGTGLYIDSLIYDFDIPKVPANEELRNELEKEAEIHGKDFIYEKLRELDPQYAKELHPNNLNYVIRALEVMMTTGKSKRDFRTQKDFLYDTLLLTPYDDQREKLYEKINLRVQKMFDDGLIEEVQNILAMWYAKNAPGLKTIGYEEIIEYLEEKISLPECIAKVQQGNRNYAKRQLTWFRKYV